jgi:MYXO-CTERM domain-containing protein
MRKAIASVGLAALLSMGMGTTAAVAQTNAVAAQAEAEETTNDDDDSSKLGLVGLLGLLGLAGLARRGGGRSAPARGGRAPRGGYNTDWSSR